MSHDFAFTFGGAERVTAALCRVVPDPTLYYIAGAPDVVDQLTPGRREALAPTWWTESNYRAVAPLLAPGTVARRRVTGNLLASSYAFAHWPLTEGRKIVYCHTPLRQAWSGYDTYCRTGPALQRLGTRLLGGSLRKHDLRAAATVDQFIATSRAVRDRIVTFYGVTTEVPIIPPPISSEFAPGPGEERAFPRDYYLWAGRIIEPYKRVSLLIEYFSAHPDKRLVIAGDGRDRHALERHAPENISFVGWQDAASLSRLYAGAKALLFPSEDDFGLAPIEANRHGTSVIAFAAGGALDTVAPDETGTLFSELTVSALGAAVDRLEALDIDPRYLVERTLALYSIERFEADLSQVVTARV